jgi:superfamily II DNA or RNA helicase
MLADAVGLGKTRVALSIASALARDARKTGAPSADVLCLAPAKLRAQWELAAREAGLTRFEVWSHARLSQRGPCGRSPAVVIVDEAHKFRNPRTNRSKALAEMARGAAVVMLSATPICNSVFDLYQLLRVFCAEEDFRGLVGYDLREAFVAADRGEFDITELLRYVVIRRTAPASAAGFGRRPSVRLEMLRYNALEDEAWLWGNLEAEIEGLELTILRDDWPRGLFSEYLLKRWESGPGALAESLERLVEYHRRWLQARECGRSLTRAVFKELFGEARTMRQEVFPFVFGDASDGKPPGDAAVRRDLERLDALYGRARSLKADGDGRVQAVVDLARRLDGKLLAFASYQSSANELFEALEAGLGARARVALVTGGESRATGLGRASPDEILRRFAPRAHGVDEMEPHHQIEVLVATDCLSEGVNLQDCSHIVLADLPYSPLAVEQRIGRLVRPGAARDVVTVYLPRPRRWADSLGLRRRLRGKLDAAARGGTSFSTASQLLIEPPESPADQAVEDPLAAMTRLDRLSESVGAARAGPMSREDYVARGARHEPALWVRYVTRDGRDARFGWLRATESSGVVARLGANLPWLIAATEIDDEVVEGAPPESLVSACEGFLARRRRRLRSARAAPRQIGIDSPQRALWKRLCEGVDAGRLAVGPEELGRLRDAVLRAHARGRMHQIERVVGQSASYEQCLKVSRALARQQKRRSGTLEVEVLGRLFIGPSGG